MTNLDVLKRSLAYDSWANRCVADTLRGLESIPKDILSLFGHLVAAQQLWLDRVHGDESSIAVWPDLSFDEIDERLRLVADAWKLLLENQREDKLLRPIAYTNSRGAPWANRVEEIMHHVALHSAHHRGQIALFMRQSGIDPPLTDFIHAVRMGQLEDSMD